MRLQRKVGTPLAGAVVMPLAEAAMRVVVAVMPPVVVVPRVVAARVRSVLAAAAAVVAERMSGVRAGHVSAAEAVRVT
jgi:hypothetical protein